MSEHENDGHYWEPDVGFPLRQGDLLVNVPSTLLHGDPEFVLRVPGGRDARLERYERFPDVAPTTEIVVEARWGALAMVVTPTCHIAEGEKDEDIVAVVPVEPLAIIVPRSGWAELHRGKGPIHLFYLPPTKLGDGLIPWDAVALLDRPTSLLKHELTQYRRVALYRDFRFELRKKLASFWARASAAENLDKQLARLRENDVPLERIE